MTLWRPDLRKIPQEIREEIKKNDWLIRHRRWLRNLFWTFIFMLLSAITIPGIGYLVFYNYTGRIPFVGDLKDDYGNQLDFEKLSRDEFLKSSITRDRNNEIIGRFFYENRDVAAIDDIPDLFKYAFIATEDKRFNPDRPNHLTIDHICDPLYDKLFRSGIDPCAIIRAFLRRLMRDPSRSGASTIAQQVARQTYAEEVAAFVNRDQTYLRKIKEARVAIQLVKRHPKDKILLSLINTSWFNHSGNGVKEACRYYFNKECRELADNSKESLRAAVILASMNKSAVIYCPIFHEPSEPTDKKNKEAMEKYQTLLDIEVARIARTRERNNAVLARTLEDGYITREQYEEALFKEDEPRKLDIIKIRPLRNPQFGYANRTVKEFILSKGISDHQITHTDGLQIYTTFDTNIQKIATEEFEKHIKLINRGLDENNHVEGALAIIEVKTGGIVALIGGSDYNRSQFNRSLAYRSPGSGYKPFVYAAALESGFDLFDKFCNMPFTMTGRDGQPWSPKNFTEKNPRPMDCSRYLFEGIKYSLNLLTLDIAKKITMDPIINLSNRVGIWGNLGISRDSKGKIRDARGIIRDSRGDFWLKMPHHEIRGGLIPLLPTAIGASDVSLLELLNAYAVFFRHGVYKQPSIIRDLRDTRGKKLITIEPSYEEQVMSSETADKVVATMRTVTEAGGTAQISMHDMKQPVACKTGTSDGPRDVSIWCGTPEYVIGIRFGRDDYGIINIPEYMRMRTGDPEMQVTGGWVAGFLAADILKRIYMTREISPFSDTVEKYHQEILNYLQ